MVMALSRCHWIVCILTPGLGVEATLFFEIRILPKIGTPLWTPYHFSGQFPDNFLTDIWSAHFWLFTVNTPHCLISLHFKIHHHWLILALDLFIAQPSPSLFLIIFAIHLTVDTLELIFIVALIKFTTCDFVHAKINQYALRLRVSQQFHFVLNNKSIHDGNAVALKIACGHHIVHVAREQTRACRTLTKLADCCKLVKFGTFAHFQRGKYHEELGVKMMLFPLSQILPIRPKKKIQCSHTNVVPSWSFHLRVILYLQQILRSSWKKEQLRKQIADDWSDSSDNEFNLQCIRWQTKP